MLCTLDVYDTAYYQETDKKILSRVQHPLCSDKPVVKNFMLWEIPHNASCKETKKDTNIIIAPTGSYCIQKMC